MNENGYVELGKYASSKSSNYREAVNYYEGLKAQLDKRDDRSWFENGEVNPFGDEEAVLPMQTLTEVEDAYYADLLADRAPTLNEWLARHQTKGAVESND